MLKRKIWKKIDAWYQLGKKALLIDGARQIGKTTIIEEYLKQNGIPYLEVNLHNDANARTAFNTSKTAEQLLLRLTALSDKELIPGKTIIFIDEIQEADDAVTPIKFLVQDNSYRYIFSGSLLGVKLKNVRSIPVGFLETYQMYPMDFEEFLTALNVSDKTISYLRDCYDKKEEVDSLIHDELIDLFHIYLAVGGLPEAVETFVKTHNMSLINPVFKIIDQGYRNDIAKYEKEYKLLLEDIYELIPSQLNVQNKRFILKDLNEKARFYQYESSFTWFKNSGIGLFVHNVGNPIYPLLASKERTLFKLFLCDVGLLSYKLFSGNQIQILNGDAKINLGPLYESFVAQELTAHGFPLYYNNDKKRGELDFLIENNNKIVPIEVKSGSDYQRHRALTNYMNNPSFECEYGIVFSDHNLTFKDNKIIYLPIYMTMFIEKIGEVGDQIVNFDISHLI